MNYFIGGIAGAGLVLVATVAPAGLPAYTVCLWLVLLLWMMLPASGDRRLPVPVSSGEPGRQTAPALPKPPAELRAVATEVATWAAAEIVPNLAQPGVATVAVSYRGFHIEVRTDQPMIPLYTLDSAKPGDWIAKPQASR